MERVAWHGIRTSDWHAVIKTLDQMTRKLHEVQIEKVMAEHYLFDLDQSVEKTAEILDMDEDWVRKVHDDYSRFIIYTRRSE